MDDEYYYYDDEYGDYENGGGGGAYEETWETPLEIKYSDGKHFMHSNVAECIRLLSEVVAEDPYQGRWTFKCAKMLARATRIQQSYPQMLEHFRTVANFSHADVPPAALQKAMTKFLNQSASIPPEHQHAAINIVLQAIAKAEGEGTYPSSFWVATIIRKGGLLIEEGRHGDSETRSCLEEALRVCQSDSDENQTQLYTLYALLMKTYIAAQDHPKLRNAYYAAIQIPTQLIQKRIVGSVMESGGHMFLTQGDWHAASQAFSASFQCFDECGDATRRAVALKYAALADMLLGNIDGICLSASHLQSFTDVPTVQPMFDLLGAFLKSDLTSCLGIVDSPTHSAVFRGDISVAPYVDQLFFRLRLNVLTSYVGSFIRVAIADVSKRVMLSEKDTIHLCSFAILQNMFTGSINEKTGMIRVHNVKATSEHRRSEALLDWSSVFA